MILLRELGTHSILKAFFDMLNIAYRSFLLSLSPGFMPLPSLATTNPMHLPLIRLQAVESNLLELDMKVYLIECIATLVCHQCSLFCERSVLTSTSYFSCALPYKIDFAFSHAPLWPIRVLVNRYYLLTRKLQLLILFLSQNVWTPLQLSR